MTEFIDYEHIIAKNFYFYLRSFMHTGIGACKVELQLAEK